MEWLSQSFKAATSGRRVGIVMMSMMMSKVLDWLHVGFHIEHHCTACERIVQGNSAPYLSGILWLTNGRCKWIVQSCRGVFLDPGGSEGYTMTYD